MPGRAWFGLVAASFCCVGAAWAQRVPGEDDVLPPDESPAPDELYGPPEAPPPPSPPVQKPDHPELKEPPPPQTGTPPPPAPPRALLTMDEIAVAPSRPRVTLNMFGDTSFRFDSRTPRTPAFVLSPLNFLLFGHSGKLVALSEFAFELSQGGENILVDVERLFVGWHDERFSIEAGRTHTELGYWNNAFHHGRWLQMTVERPRIVQFEDDGGILPIHSMGVTTRLRVLTGERQLDLVAAVANGRGTISDDIQVVSDTNGFKSLLLKVETKGFGARDLRLGMGAYYDHIAAAPIGLRPALPDQPLQEIIGNAYLAYRSAGPTVISEAYEIVHVGAGRSWKTFDAFVLAAYRFGILVPYASGEVRVGDIDHDPFFFPNPAMPFAELLGRFVETTAGLRWDVNTWSAIKLEYRATLTRDQSTREQRGVVDWSFGL
jgi:hypothetical protein